MLLYIQHTIENVQNHSDFGLKKETHISPWQMETSTKMDTILTPIAFQAEGVLSLLGDVCPSNPSINFTLSAW